jgi:hypothetical protein
MRRAGAMQAPPVTAAALTDEDSSAGTAASSTGTMRYILARANGSTTRRWRKRHPWCDLPGMIRGTLAPEGILPAETQSLGGHFPLPTLGCLSQSLLSLRHAFWFHFVTGRAVMFRQDGHLAFP